MDEGQRARKRDGEKDHCINRAADQRRYQRCFPPCAVPQSRKNPHVQHLSDKKGQTRANGDTDGHKRAKLTHDLGPDKRTDDAHNKTDQNDTARGGGAVDAVHHVGDQKGEGVGESAPCQPVSVEELNEDIGCDHDGGHGNDAGKICACHDLNRFLQGCGDLVGGNRGQGDLGGFAQRCKLFLDHEIDNLGTLYAQKVIVGDGCDAQLAVRITPDGQPFEVVKLSRQCRDQGDL